DHSWTWDKTGVAPGTYEIQAWVRNAGMTVTYDAWAGGYLTVRPPPSAPVLDAIADRHDTDAPAGYDAVPRADSPIAYWRLGDAAGSAASDLVASHDARLAGGVTAGQPGVTGDGDRSMAFDGVSGRLEADLPAGSLSGDLTLEL